MAGFNVNLYTFTKKVDSTAQPTGTGTQYLCNILTPADITAPVIEITASADLTAYNYAYISAFHRYYWIEGITFDRGIWTLALAVDVLATYKTYIGGETLFVLRAQSSSDGNITDNYYPVTASVTKRHQEQAVSGIPGYQYDSDQHEWTLMGYSGGYIVLNVAGIGTAGATTLILMTTDTFRDLVALLYTSIDGFQLTDVVRSVVQKFGGNPQELINGAMWMPWPFNGDNYDVIKIGAWEAIDYTDPNNPVSLNGLYIDDPVYEMADITLTINKHPQASTRGNYLNLAPYTSYMLGVPGCGVIPLDNSKLLNETSITIRRTIDAFSGQYQVNVLSTSGGQILAHLTGQIGVPISLRGTNNADKIMGGAINTVGKALQGNVIGTIEAGIGTIWDAVGGTPTSTGMGGGFAEILGKPIWLDTLHYAITDEDISHNGRPLMQLKTISSLSGFVQVQKGDVPIPGTSAEADRVKSYLEGGFFYE